ncbi:4'-phosphopantetheinyl transferase family protein [Pseudodonghicola flavimaris]|uniref:Enterobactin synthase component D n=1 Tax=Pseudodonghicola flavimaris TaxID=3050036 RepID=A0ABT7F3I3_9RHOB|nr:4'-phosphopantetheinyl transferase superfamily protein [Pseudodonghicola flavimaris]MDK3019173.1 4'-phosphopantetheinyl transferase superfamily protein [Pseudodonghicola flavimaris]
MTAARPLPAPSPAPDAGALVRSLLPRDVAVAATDPRTPQPALWPEERAGLPRARPARLREFAAGRSAARHALAQLGLPPAAIAHGIDRAPVWPAGVVGSISHCSNACVAVLARAGRLSALGIDLEEEVALPLDLIPAICTPAEAARLALLPPARRGLIAKVIFSAKEAAYKAQFPLSGRLFGFQTLEVRLEPETGRFSADFLQDIPPFRSGTRLQGHFVIGQGLIATIVTLSA